MNIEIKYVTLDPFNCSVADLSNGIIYIDHKFKGTPLEKKLITHEMKHFENQSPLFEPVSDLEVNMYWETIKVKPLSFFQLFFPFILINDGKKTMFKMDILSIGILILFLGVLGVALTFSAIHCTSDIITGIETCIRCNALNVLYGCVPL